jgi:hypothetical protein
MPTSTARRIRSYSQSISSPATVRVSVPPELADPLCPVEVRESENMEELGAAADAFGYWGGRYIRRGISTPR